MDYTKIPRGLIFRDRNSLDEFTDGNPLNAVIIDNMEDIDELLETNLIIVH